jgi:hypothetical protein
MPSPSAAVGVRAMLRVIAPHKFPQKRPLSAAWTAQQSHKRLRTPRGNRGPGRSFILICAAAPVLQMKLRKRELSSGFSFSDIWNRVHSSLPEVAGAQALLALLCSAPRALAHAGLVHPPREHEGNGYAGACTCCPYPRAEVPGQVQLAFWLPSVSYVVTFVQAAFTRDWTARR